MIKQQIEPDTCNSNRDSDVRGELTNKTIFIFLLTVLVNWNSQSFAQEKKSNLVTIAANDTKVEIIRKAANVVPSREQYDWQKMEYIAFVHFGLNTFTSNELGNGSEDPKLFNPTSLDCDEWARVFKNAGIKMAILTAKHHDGFCLWPSKYTDYSVKKSNWKNGKGDVVREFVNACRKYNLKVGFYLSPWDRNNPSYGTSRYNEYFMDQLIELLSNYGKITEVWFDGYKGTGSKSETYDWHSYYKLIRKLQPQALIAIMGDDIRWVGTESGYGRETEWDVLPIDLSGLTKDEISKEVHPIDEVFTPRNYLGNDLGSRDSLYDSKGLFWYPSETDVSIRPNWFYVASQDSAVKSVAQLVDIYFNSVGKNSVLLLNVPADKRGLISSYDIRALRGLHDVITETFRTNMASSSIVNIDGSGKAISFFKLFGNDRYWSANKGSDTASLEFEFNKEKTFDVAMLQEQIKVGQRIEKFHIDYWDGNGWQNLTSGTTVGYKRLLRFNPVTTTDVRLVIDKSRLNPTLFKFGLYMLPPVYVHTSP